MRGGREAQMEDIYVYLELIHIVVQWKHNIVEQLFSKWKFLKISLHYATRIFYASGFFFSEIVMINFLSFFFILSTIIHEIVLTCFCIVLYEEIFKNV